MIDTLRLRLNDYEIKNQNKLKLQPPTINLNDGTENESYILYKNSNYSIEGNRAYYNDDKINLTLQTKNGIPYLFIQFSAPKLLSGSNYHLLNSRETLINSLQDTEKRLKDIGIATNINDAYLSRLDLTRNVFPKYSYSTYRPLFENLLMTRAQKRDYGTTFLYGNKQKQFVIYDKLKEMEHRKELTAGLPTTIRNELRFMTAKKIKAKTGNDTAADLVRTFEDLPIIYNSTIENELLRGNAPQNFEDVIVSDIIFNDIAKLCTTTKGFSISAYSQRSNVYLLGLRSGQKQNFLQAIKDNSPRLEYKSRAEKIINDIERLLFSIKINDNCIYLSELYEEYFGLLLKAA